MSSYTLNGSPVSVGYDGADQITSLSSSSQTASYGYDVLSRLVSYQGINAQSFSYDANGNRTSLTSSAGSTAYGYDSNSNRLSSVMGSSSAQISHDANGATLGDGARQFVYDARGRLQQTITAQGAVSYEVNALGLRVRKVAAGSGASPATDTLFFYDTQGQLIGETSNSSPSFTKEYVYLGNMPVAVLTGTSVNYIHADHLNTPRTITSTTGAVVWQWENLDPFGNNAANENPAGLGRFEFNLRFPGQYFDKETSTHYNINRNYDSGIGRYIESDPIGLEGGLNTYTYVEGNPLSEVDPLGLANSNPNNSSGGAFFGGGGIGGAGGGGRSFYVPPRTTSSNQAVEQYSLRAAESGFYPVMTRGNKEATSLRWCERGDVWKFGTTKNPSTRYSTKYLDNIGEYGVTYSKEFTGTLFESLKLESMKIRNVIQQTGSFPPGNKMIK